jgi:hypothetical protein
MLERHFRQPNTGRLLVPRLSPAELEKDCFNQALQGKNKKQAAISMPLIRPRRRRASKFKRHVKAHKTVVCNEAWYGDGPPILAKQFNAQKTAERAQMLVKILVRAAKRGKKAHNQNLARTYKDLAKKLKTCRPNARCGSLACPQCARAFQKAKVEAQEALISHLKISQSRKKLVMASLIPLHMTFRPAALAGLDIQKRNRWFKDILRRAGFDRVMFGSADVSWEAGGCYQLHWHIGMWTANPKNLTTKLKKLFPSQAPYDRPVQVSVTRDLRFLAYKDKGIKLPDLLRRNRTHLPELLLALDRTEPLDLMVLMKLRISTQEVGLLLKLIRE